MTEAAEISRVVRRLSFRYYFLVYRQAARRVLDQLRFGDGLAERLAAALVSGALFFLVILLVSLITKANLGVGLGIAATALIAAWVTSAVFVFGSSDEVLAQEIEQARVALEERRLAAAVMAEEAKRQAAEEGSAGEEREHETSSASQPPRRREERPARAMRCPYCDELIAVRAVKCKHCGEIIDESLRRQRERGGRRQSFYPVAAFLSWLFPGLGQIYKGQLGRGLLWMLAVFVGLGCCIVPGVVISVLSIFDAAVYNEA